MSAAVPIKSVEAESAVLYHETGGLRWGSSFGSSWNATWPFASFLLSKESLLITASFLDVFRREFRIQQKDVVAMKKYRGFISAGVQIEHSIPGYPPFILFWSFSPHRLLETARNIDYPVAG